MKTSLMVSIGIVLTLPFTLWAGGQDRYVAMTPEVVGFPLVENGRAAALHVDSADWPGVIRAVADLETDIDRVTGITPEVRHSASSRSQSMVIEGTPGIR